MQAKNEIKIAWRCSLIRKITDRHHESNPRCSRAHFDVWGVGKVDVDGLASWCQQHTVGWSLKTRWWRWRLARGIRWRVPLGGYYSVISRRCDIWWWGSLEVERWKSTVMGAERIDMGIGVASSLMRSSVYRALRWWGPTTGNVASPAPSSWCRGACRDLVDSDRTLNSIY